MYTSYTYINVYMLKEEQCQQQILIYKYDCTLSKSYMYSSIIISKSWWTKIYKGLILFRQHIR